MSFLQLVAPLAVADNCKSSSGLEGACLSAQDCLKRGGRGLETCAWGLGVCCVRKCDLYSPCHDLIALISINHTHSFKNSNNHFFIVNTFARY